MWPASRNELPSPAVYRSILTCEWFFLTQLLLVRFAVWCKPPTCPAFIWSCTARRWFVLGHWPNWSAGSGESGFSGWPIPTSLRKDGERNFEPFRNWAESRKRKPVFSFLLRFSTKSLRWKIKRSHFLFHLDTSLQLFENWDLMLVLYSQTRLYNEPYGIISIICSL